LSTKCPVRETLCTINGDVRKFLLDLRCEVWSNSGK